MRIPELNQSGMSSGNLKRPSLKKRLIYQNTMNFQKNNTVEIKYSDFLDTVMFIKQAVAKVIPVDPDQGSL